MPAAVERDVLIVGGGPAGLAAAIATSSRGFSTVVLEQSRELPDKACGEGLMPPGVHALAALGARSLIAPADCAPFAGVRFVQEDGTAAEGHLPFGGGLGVRRLALVAALDTRARASGAEVRQGVRVVSHRRTTASIEVETEEQVVFRGQLLIAADGLNSPTRRAMGLELPIPARHRFGLRQHFRIRPWCEFVEVYLNPDFEAYVTPCGVSRIGVAFLWDASKLNPRTVSIPSFLEKLPLLASRLGGAEPDSRPRGAGPLARRVRSCTADRVILIGDAAGYVDAITGEGISLALESALKLGEILPQAIAAGLSRDSLAPYEHDFRRRYRRYEIVARAMLALARVVPARRFAFHALGRTPRLFEAALRFAVAGATQRQMAATSL